MDEFEELRRGLGPAADYHDAELRHLSREMDLIAEFLLDLYMARHSGKEQVKGSRFDRAASEPLA